MLTNERLKIGSGAADLDSGCNRRLLHETVCRFEHRFSRETCREKIPGNRSLFVLCTCISRGLPHHKTRSLRIRFTMIRRRSSPPGAMLALVEGNPMASAGNYAVFLKMPDRYKIAAHWHPKWENVTVISGNFKVGMGDKFDEAKTMIFPAGSFAYLDPDIDHGAMASGEEVVQVQGMSPLQFNYVSPGG